MNTLLSLTRVRGAARVAALASFLWLSSGRPAHAIIADPRPAEFTQPDGSKVTLRLRGDEFFHWQEDVNGFTVVRQDGRYVYARLDAQNRLVPTEWQAGQTDPRTVGLAPGVLPPPELRPKNLNDGSKPYRPWLAQPGARTGVPRSPRWGPSITSSSSACSATTPAACTRARKPTTTSSSTK